LPFKLNQDRRHAIPKQRLRVMNSDAYDAASRQRGSPTMWFTAEATARHPDAAVIVPPRSNDVPSGTADTAPMQRDRHMAQISNQSLRKWQSASGHDWHALVRTSGDLNG